MATQLDIWPLIESTWLGTEGALDGIRTVLSQASSMSPGYTMRALSFLGQLQSVTGEPYPSFVRNASLISDSDPLLPKLSKYWLMAMLVYPPSLLRRNHIKLTDGVEDSDPIGTLLLKQDPALEIILGQRSTINGCPAFMLIADHKAEIAILAVRGSLEVADWAINVNCKISEEGYHTGMWQAAEALDEKVRDILTTLLETRPSWSLVLTGHSLGAGVASFLTVQWLKYRPLALKTQPNIHCYAYGPPSGALASAKASFEENITSVVYGRDCVPKCNLHSLETLVLRLNSIGETMRREDEAAVENSNIAISLFKNLFPTVAPIRRHPVLDLSLPISIIRDRLDSLSKLQYAAWREVEGITENKVSVFIKRLFSVAVMMAPSQDLKAAPESTDLETIVPCTISTSADDEIHIPRPTSLNMRIRRAFSVSRKAFSASRRAFSASQGALIDFSGRDFSGETNHVPAPDKVGSETSSWDTTDELSSRSDTCVSDKPKSRLVSSFSSEDTNDSDDSLSQSGWNDPQELSQPKSSWWYETVPEDQQSMTEAVRRCISGITSQEPEVYPLGRIICIVPKAHYFAYGVPHPDKATFSESTSSKTFAVDECFIYEGTSSSTLRVHDDFIVGVDSISDHFLNKYSYALCPELLSLFPTNLPAR